MIEFFNFVIRYFKTHNYEKFTQNLPRAYSGGVNYRRLHPMRLKRPKATPTKSNVSLENRV